MKLAGETHAVDGVPAEPCLLAKDATDVRRWHVAGWVTANGDIDWPRLLAECGHFEVPVAHCSLAAEGAVGRQTAAGSSGGGPSSPRSQVRPASSTTMTLADFRRTQWRAPGWPKPYLKDWHACLDLKDTQKLFITPPLFRDDFLNDWLSTKPGSSDYRFVYIGPAGSRTGVHTDVLHSNSWSAQLSGTKRWLLLPPEHAHLVEDANGICNVDAFPDRVASELCREVVQRPGEIIFIPGGWYHAVENIDDSLSLNVNWIDSASLERSWNHLLKEYRIAEHYIEDLRPLTSPAEFETLVDRNAKLQCGMSKADFIEMVRVGMNMDMDMGMGMGMGMNTCPDPHEPPDHRLIQRRRAYGNRFLAWSQRGAGRQDDNARRETMMS
mmetsp:Transcript_15273/g.43494  ORF Transcript_15273/g.43494 Transcript_15273/m.43494 type:complete len:382 (+) Transcript_15273:3233-4378(+)